MAYAHIPKDECYKFDSKVRKCVLFGYDELTKGYRLYDESKKIVCSRDDRFLVECLNCGESAFGCGSCSPVDCSLSSSSSSASLLSIETASCSGLLSTVVLFGVRQPENPPCTMAMGYSGPTSLIDACTSHAA